MGWCRVYGCRIEGVGGGEGEGFVSGGFEGDYVQDE